MAINVSQAFHRTSANPIDDTLTLTKAQMLTINDNLMPSKYLTVCQDDGFIYLYDKSNASDETTGKFRKLEANGLRFEVVETLPTENIRTDTIYLVPKTVGTSVSNLKDEYINTDGTSAGWECIGDTSIDLSDYVTNSALNTALADYTTTANLSAIALASNVDLTGLSDGDVLVYDVASGKWIPGEGGGSGGDASLTTDVTSNLAVGAIASGTTLPEGTTFTEFAQKLLISEIAPTTTFSASGSGTKEVGTSVTPTLTLNITGKGTGTPVAIKFYSGSTLLDTQNYVDGTNTYSFTMTDAITTTTTVKGVLEYKKSDNTNASIEKTASYTFVMASYYGAVTTAPTDKAGIIALTKNVKTGRGLTATFTLNNQRSCYAYPASMGNLTSIKDANNFEYLSSYTKTSVTVDDVAYNVYTLTDPVTATGFKQVYA